MGPDVRVHIVGAAVKLCDKKIDENKFDSPALNLLSIRDSDAK